MKKILFIESLTDHFKYVNNTTVKQKEKLDYLIFVYNGRGYLFEINIKKKNIVYYNNENFFDFDISLIEKEKVVENGIIYLLNKIKTQNRDIIIVKNNSDFLKDNKIIQEVIPVFEGYSRKDDNLEYYLRSFGKIIKKDKQHPLFHSFETSFIKLAEIKLKELLNNQRYDIINNVINEYYDLFEKSNRLKFYKALFYYHRGAFYEGAEILFEIIEEAVNNSEPVILLSRILDEINKTDEALKIIEEKLEFFLDDDLLLLEYFRILLKTEKIDTIGEFFKKDNFMINIKEENKCYFLYYKGIYEMINGNISEALGFFESVRGTPVDDMYLRLNILQIYKLLNKIDKFIDERKNIYERFDLDRATKEKINEWENDLLNNEEGEDYDEVNFDGKKSDSTEVTEEIKNALEEANKFVELNPKNPWGFYSLGSLLLKIGRTEEAEENFLKSLKLDENNGIVHHGLGIIYSRRNKNEKAIEFFKKAIISKVNDENKEIYSKWNYDTNLAYFSLADSYIRLKKIDEAIVVLKKGLEFDAKAFMPHFQLGTCYEYKKEHFKALESYFNVKKLNSEFTLVDFYIGNCYMVLQDNKNTVKYLKAYLENDKELIYKEYAEEIIKKIENKLD